MPTFFKKCPSCGRRFGVRMVAKTEGGDEVERSRPSYAAGAQMGPRAGSPHAIDSGVVQSDSTTTVEKAVHVETFECTKCGHQWNESVTDIQGVVVPVDD